MSTRLGALAAGGVVLVALVGSATPAAATQGSVPLEVAEYAAAPDGLVSGLADFFGPGADGRGIDFDGSTEFGALARVFAFAPEWLDGGGAGVPVELTNEWAVPVTVAGEPVGVAIIWINPGTVRPQLADFTVDPDFAQALPQVAEAAYLVEDDERDAWFAVEPPGMTVLVGGSSGLSGRAGLEDYRAMAAPSGDTPPAEEAPKLGSALSVGITVAVALAVVLALLVPIVRRRRNGPPGPEEGGGEPG